MKYIYNLLAIIGTVALLSSCEDIIELDLDNTDPRIVIEAVADMIGDSIHIDITQSNDFYDNGDPIRLEDAIIEITDAAGNVTSIPSDAAGAYTLNNYSFTAREEYSLKIQVGGETYNASTAAPEEVPLVNIDTILSAPPFGNGDPFYQSLFRWQDAPGGDNYYRVKAFINDTLQGQPSFYDDNNLDGQLFVRPLMAVVRAGDFVEFQLINLDAETYNYFVQLIAVQSQGFGGSVPFNPQGNFDNKALGYFGIQNTNSISIQF